MRVRKQTATGDKVWTGNGPADFYVNDPQCVGQVCYTRLNLIQGEAYLDSTAGLNLSAVLGNNTQATNDLAIRDEASGTQGFADFASYSSYRDPNARTLSVSMTIDTVYSASIGAPGLSPTQTTVTAGVTI